MCGVNRTGLLKKGLPSLASYVCFCDHSSAQNWKNCFKVASYQLSLLVGQDLWLRWDGQVSKLIFD